jgi:predicted outer membrane protein
MGYVARVRLNCDSGSWVPVDDMKGDGMKLRIATASLLGSMAVVASMGMGSVAAQPGGGGGQLSQQDRTFMTQNAQTDQAEIVTGQLAAQHGTNQQIRQAGQTLMTDHQQALSKLQGVAQSMNVTLPNSPNPTQQQEAQQLKAASGAAFDQLFLQNEIKGHQTSISNTQQEIQSGSEAQVVDFAKSYLPVAQQHLRMLQEFSSAKEPSGAQAPSGVNAGSGGQAANSGMPPALVGGLAAGGAIVVLTSGGMVLALRRRE